MIAKLIRDWLPTVDTCRWTSCQEDGSDIRGVSIQFEWRCIRFEICLGCGRAA